jgi:glycosyltransferase involved in cell wall biosynthesis
MASRWGSPRSLSMLGWALNEQDNIAEYIDRAEQFLSLVADDFELVLIDDGSTDGTWQLVSESQRTRPWLRPFQNGRNRGSGYNTKRAIGLAQKDYLLWQTVDWSYDIDLLGQSLALLETSDVLQGVRADTLSLSGLLRRRSDTPTKAGISILNYMLIRLLFQLPLHDYQNVTVYPRQLIQSVHLESESAFTNPECLLKVWWRGATIHEVPVPFLKRERGEAKGTRPGAVLAAMRDVGYWWWQWVVLGRRTDKGVGHVVTQA